MSKILTKVLAISAICFVITGGLYLGSTVSSYVDMDIGSALSKAPDVILTVLAGLFPLIMLIVLGRLELTALAGLFALSSLAYAVLAGLIVSTGVVSEVIPDVGPFLTMMAVATGVFSFCLASEAINAYFARHIRQ